MFPKRSRLCFLFVTISTGRRISPREERNVERSIVNISSITVADLGKRDDCPWGETVQYVIVAPDLEVELHIVHVLSLFGSQARERSGPGVWSCVLIHTDDNDA